MEKISIGELKKWFLKEQRDLPWREDRSPYKVWVSEIMLQQTQVAVVVPYFHRWMKKFPTLESLASASIEEVTKLWEGLGYYSRARNLHEAARIIVEQKKGVIPQEAHELQALPGFGPYTVGAVLSFAFKQKMPAVDGNVVRVLSRFFASSQDCSKRVHYEQLTHSILPDNEPWIVMEALIELGARVCQKKPKCTDCPLMEECKAYSLGRVLDFPVPRKRPQTIQLKRQVALIVSDASILVRQEQGRKVMSGLYEFPYALLDQPLPFQISMSKLHDFPIVKHGFTRYDVTLFPTLYKTEQKEPVSGYEWRDMKTLHELPFSSGHKRILEHLYAYLTH
jgi:A/G-specific adenine glycosylase